eukprot:tig00020903_g15121.t1
MATFVQLDRLVESGLGTMDEAEDAVVPAWKPRVRESNAERSGEVHVEFASNDNTFKLSSLKKFIGPAFMISIGYMDPGNWATDIEGGSRFGYDLVWVLAVSNLMAILLQTLAARLGQVTDLHLAQLCHEEYPKHACWALWFLAELAIAATDLAEVIGTAVGLNLITGIPILIGVIITATDTVFFLAIQNFGMRKLELVVFILLSVVSSCFILEIFLCRPSLSSVLSGLFIPRLNNESVFVAMGILGATVMPHNFYLHSAVVQSRTFERNVENIRRACLYNLVDSILALNIAFFVNLSILMVSAASFYGKEEVTTLQQAHALLETLLNSKLAPFAFGLALLCAGQSSTITGTLAGQYVMEGFVEMRIRPWIRRLVTRFVAVAPAVVVIVITGDGGMYQLLLISQTILSLQLPFAVVPLLKFSGSKRLMGPFANPRWVSVLGWFCATLIVALNLWFVVDLVKDALAMSAPLAVAALILFAVLFLFLVYLVLLPSDHPAGRKSSSRHVGSSDSSYLPLPDAHFTYDAFRMESEPSTPVASPRRQAAHALSAGPSSPPAEPIPVPGGHSLHQRPLPHDEGIGEAKSDASIPRT